MNDELQLPSPSDIFAADDESKPADIGNRGNEKDFLIAEYNQLYTEIRNINDKVSVAAKLYLGLFTSLIVYDLLGIQSYINNTNKLEKPIFIIYAVIGILFTLIFYLLGHIASRQYAVSKLHRVRYWKAIHAVRKGMATFGQLNNYLILPKNSARPSISTGERITPYLFGFLNIVLASIVYWFIFILVSLEKNQIIYNESTVLSSLTIFFELFLIPSLALLPSNCVYYAKQLYRAEKITFIKTYFDFSETFKYQLVEDWKKVKFLWHKISLKQFQRYLLVCILILNVLVFTIPESTPYVCLVKIGIWLLLLFLLFAYGLIYIYPFLEPKRICWLCRNNIMPTLHVERRCKVKFPCPIKVSLSKPETAKNIMTLKTESST